MSRFYSILNNLNAANSIDDVNISTDSSYSSSKVESLVDNLLRQIPKYAIKEYPSNSPDRTEAQDIFETPDSSYGFVFRVSREGVEMEKDVDYIVLDSAHIKFNKPVLPKYTVNILIISANIGQISSSSNRFISYQSNSKVWNINHNLGFKYVNIVLVDMDDNLINGDVKYIDDNSCIVSFDVNVTGKCICSV